MVHRRTARPFRLLFAALGTVAAVSIAFIGLAGADTAVLRIGSTTLPPGGTTTITVDLQSTGADVLDFSLVVHAVPGRPEVPDSGATGSFTMSNIVATKNPTPDGGVGWNCVAADDTDPNSQLLRLVDCLWNGGSKDASKQATLTVTATATADTRGQFYISAQDNTSGTLLDSEGIYVLYPTTTTAPTTTSPTTSAPGAAEAITTTPTFTG